MLKNTIYILLFLFLSKNVFSQKIIQYTTIKTNLLGPWSLFVDVPLNKGYSIQVFGKYLNHKDTDGVLIPKMYLFQYGLDFKKYIDLDLKESNRVYIGVYSRFKYREIKYYNKLNLLTEQSYASRFPFGVIVGDQIQDSENSIVWDFFLGFGIASINPDKKDESKYDFRLGVCVGLSFNNKKKFTCLF